MDFFEILRILLIFGGGLVAGSFANCVIWRLHVKENFVSGRSYCPRCRHQLAAADLIPVFSFLVLGGKCRYCKERISRQYPIVEIASALLAVAAALFFAPGFIRFGFINLSLALVLIYYWAVCIVLEIIFVSDFLWYTIPDETIAFGAGLAIAAQAFAAVSPMNRPLIAGGHTPLNVISAAVLGALFFLGIVLISKGKWMGLGDVKYVFLMGLILGFPEILFALFMAFLSGAAIGVILILAGRKKMSSEIPFGPFLVAGTLAALFLAQPAIDLYLGII